MFTWLLCSCFGLINLSKSGFIDGIGHSECVVCNVEHNINSNQFPIRFGNFDEKEFNGLGWVDTVFSLQTEVQYQVEFETLINKVGQIIVKHGLKDYVGIANLHKHFDLDKDEKMVFFISDENTNEDEDRSDKVLNGKVLTDRNECDEQGNIIIPYMFKLEAQQSENNYYESKEEHTWLPLQYICDSPESQLKYLDEMMQNGMFDAFLNDISNFMVNHKVTNIIGLYWRYNKYSSLVNVFNGNQDVKLLEKTSIDERTQTFEKVATFESSYLSTQYMFEAMGCVTESSFDNFINDQCIAVPPTACRDSYCQWDPFRGHVYYHTVTDE